MTTTETLTYAVHQSTLTGLGLLDHQQKFVEVNDAFCRIYGYLREELLGKSLHMLEPAGFKERAHLFYQDYLKGNMGKGFRQIRRKDGSSATVYLAQETLSGEQASFRLLSLVEMPPLPEPEPKPASGEKNIAENTDVALLRCSRQGEILFANEAARSLFFLPQGHRSLDTQVFVFSGDIHREVSLIRLLNEKSSFERIELLLKRPDETQAWVLMSAKPLILEGELCYDISVVDIESLKKLEKKLLSRIEDLKSINKQLDHFVYGATHDLKAPLASVSGLITILRHEKDPAQRELYFQLMDKSIHRLNEFIKEIVDYSRNANQELHIEKIDFQAMIDDVFEGLEYMTNAATIRKTISVRQKTPFYGDEHRLKVILNNLVSNAYKYSSTHRRDCFIEVDIRSDSKQATIQVRDNGQGISKEHVDKIFDMFFRASEGQGGTGLGLYIVKETISKMQGNIHVVSELGQGTCFVVTIPSLHPASQKMQMKLDI